MGLRGLREPRLAGAFVGADGKPFSSVTGNTRCKPLVVPASVFGRFQPSVKFPAATQRACLPKAESFAELELLKKGDSRKVACAAMVKARTSVSNNWIVQRLAMGCPASMSHGVHRMRRDMKAAEK
jgi:hypothetical protein